MPNSDAVGTNNDNQYTPTIILIGASNTGKSTLINTILNLKLLSISSSSPSQSLTTTQQVPEEAAAPTRAGGTPCTQYFRSYGPSPSSPIRLIDTRGLERLSSPTQLPSLISYIAKRDQHPITSSIDAVWYLPDERWLPDDTIVMQTLKNKLHIPIIIIATKCDSAGRREIDKTSGLTAVDLTIKSIMDDFGTNLPVFKIGIPMLLYADTITADNDVGAPPRQCSNGHDRSYFVENRRRKTWRCDYIEFEDNEEEGVKAPCNQSGTFEIVSPFGINELLNATFQTVKIMEQRTNVIKDNVRYVSRRKKARALINGAFWRSFMDRAKTSTDITKEIEFSNELFSAYGVTSGDILGEEWVLEVNEDIAVAVKKEIRKKGTFLLSEQTIEGVKKVGVVGWLVGTRVDAFLSGIGLQVFGMGIISTLEYVLYLRQEEGRQQEDVEEESLREAGQSRRVENDGFNEMVVRECLRRDVMDMEKERQSFDEEMNVVANVFENRISKLTRNIENSYFLNSVSSTAQV